MSTPNSWSAPPTSIGAMSIIGSRDVFVVLYSMTVLPQSPVCVCWVKRKSRIINNSWNHTSTAIEYRNKEKRGNCYVLLIGLSATWKMCKVFIPLNLPAFPPKLYWWWKWISVPEGIMCLTKIALLYLHMWKFNNLKIKYIAIYKITKIQHNFMKIGMHFSWYINSPMLEEKSCSSMILQPSRCC